MSRTADSKLPIPVFDMLDKKQGLMQHGFGNDFGYFHSRGQEHISHPIRNEFH